LLANVYLHYVLDLRAEWRRKRHASGDVIVVRFAGDFITGFQYRDDAERFPDELRGRFARSGLELHPDKTRLTESGPHAARLRAARGDGKPETFSFPGSTHLCAASRSGRFWIRRKTGTKRLQAKLEQVKTEIMRRRHRPVPEQGKWPGSVIRGHQAHYAVPGNISAVSALRTQAARHWRHALGRRSQKGRITWDRMNRLAARWLPPSHTRHPFPEQRFAASHPWQEPSAVIPLAGICAGGPPATAVPTATAL
jgi:RNA-directed DNA polymerase